ncbi:hypothetical protein M569_07924, partial [Genlisea aurea]
ISLFSSPPDTLLVHRAIAILKRYDLSLLGPLAATFTHPSASYLLLRSRNNRNLVLKFLDWARGLPFFRDHLQCYCLSIHILTRFKLYKTAQSLAEEVALRFPQDEHGDSVFSCLRDTYQACESSSGVFDLVVKAFSNLKLTDRALNMIYSAKCCGFMPSVLSYNAVLEAIFRNSSCRNVDSARCVFHEMMENGISPNVYTYNVLIRGLCANKEMNQGLSLFEQMEKRGVLPNVVTFNTVIDAYCKSRNIDQAYGLLKQMWERNLEPNVITYNVIINGLCKEGRIKETDDVLVDMKAKGLAPNEITYNTLVDGYCKEGNFHQALALHAEMVKNGLSPNVVTYTCLINSLCKAGNLQRAMDYFNQMAVRGLKPNEKTYTTLIDGFSQQGFMDEAYGLVEEMISKGFSPSIVTYNALINGHCQLGRVDEGLNVIQTMTSRGVFPDVVSYSSIINGYCRNLDLDKAFSVKEDMSQKGIFPDTITYSSLIQGLCELRRLDEACKLFTEMSSKLNLLPDKCTYTCLINAYCAENDIPKAIHLHDEMIRRGLFPDVISYNVLVNGINKQSRSDEARRLLFKSTTHGSQHEYTHDYLIQRCISVASLMKAFCMNGLMNEADRLLMSMKEKPSEVIYNVVIRGHCRAGNLAKAMELYSEMVRVGFAAHAGTVISIIEGLHEGGMMEELRKVLEETFRSCKVVDGDGAKLQVEVNYGEGNMDAVFKMIRDMARDGLLPN